MRCNGKRAPAPLSVPETASRACERTPDGAAPARQSACGSAVRDEQTVLARLATPNENEAARARLACQSKPLLPRVRAKASRGFEPRSLDSESRVLTVTPRGRLHTHRARPLRPKQGPAMQKLAAPHASARDGNAPPQPRRSRAKSSTTTRMMAQTLGPAYRFPTEDDEEGQPG